MFKKVMKTLKENIFDPPLEHRCSNMTAHIVYNNYMNRWGVYEPWGNKIEGIRFCPYCGERLE
jgi:hypothetical protein